MRAFARRAPRRDRRSARGLAAHRPPSAAGGDGQPGRRAAIGAHRDPARRRVAGDARKGAQRSPPISPSSCACAPTSRPSESALDRDLAALADERQRMTHPDRGATEEAGRNRKGARERTAECGRALAPGRQPEGPDHPPGTGHLDRGQGRAQRRPPGRGTKARRAAGPRGASRIPGGSSRPLHSPRSRAICRCRRMASKFVISAPPTASAAPKRAFRSQHGRARRSPPV